jgi:hypothetical protein
MKQTLTALESLITVVLVVTGIVGVAYHGFRDGGWVTRGFGALTSAYIDYPLMALGLTVALFFTYRAWRGRRSSGGGGRYYDLVLYIFMAAGIYFIGHYVITGEV